MFLAAATHFNTECRFLLLDDVVSSFDADKRPQLIELLKNHLKEYQVLLLTHDRFWRELLYRRLPTWKRLNFTRYTFGVGPVVSPAMDAFERVLSLLDEDEPEAASAVFARYLEDVMQDLCEAFEVEVKFNRRSEYTLDTLIDRFRVRAVQKLKSNHPLCASIQRAFEDNAYRNWSIHCKNPESPIHSKEIASVVANWKSIEQSVKCKDCHELLHYDDAEGFRCSCGNGELKRIS